MRKIIFIIICQLIIFKVFGQKTNLAASQSIAENYFGVEIVDEYRNLEDLKNPQTIDWMKSQTNYSNSVLNKIPLRDYYMQKRMEFDKRQGYSISNLKITDNDKYFYLKRNANEKIAKLYHKHGFFGKEELLYDPTNYRSSEQNHSFIINYISPSWNGNKIAISITEKGKELSDIIIMDVKTSYIHPEVIKNVAPRHFRWRKMAR